MPKPLAEKMRPKDLSEYIGQSDLVSKDKPIYNMLESGTISSMILWGPAACGKTTLARIVASRVDAQFYELSAISSGKEDLKKIISQAAHNRDGVFEFETVVFIDEIHRWNKAQQDALLPYVENGTITLIGATTENPSFSIISPLLSRARVFVCTSHSKDDIQTMLNRAIATYYKSIKIPKDVISYIAQYSHGDMRFALNTLEMVCSGGQKITVKSVQEVMQKPLSYDKKGDEHFTIISAVHKSMRSSNPTASVYWVVRMLEAGEDPLYIARRLLRFASEDIGNKNPNALLLANTVFDTCHKLGTPECTVALVQLAEYLAKSPKSNASYKAYQLAQKDCRAHGALPVPLHLRNASTSLLKDLGYGNGYEYDHDIEGGKSNQQCMPDGLEGADYFKK